MFYTSFKSIKLLYPAGWRTSPHYVYKPRIGSVTIVKKKVETMNEGTTTLAFDNTILYCNRRFAELLNTPLQAIIGTPIYRFIAPENKSTFNALLKHKMGMGDVNLRAEGDMYLPVYMSINSFQVKGSPSAWCLVVTDLTWQKKNEEILANIEIARKKEIHHLIKNNLQVISSLLDLQADKFNNREDRTRKFWKPSGKVRTE